MKCYVEYQNSENGFRKSIKYFDTFDDAWDWVCETFDKPDVDVIYFY